MKIKAIQGYGYTEYAEKCDNCGEQSRTTNEDFSELNKINKASGWRFKYIDGEFKAYCPKCKAVK